MTHSRAMRNILLLAGGLALAGSARAATIKPKMTGQPSAVPAGIHYQGRLEDNGIPANNTYTMTFTLYDDPTAGNLVWPASQDPANINVMAVPVSVGLFAVDLPISTMSLVRAGLKYLQVNINGVDLSPREQLGNVPYAMVAKTIEGTINISTGGFNLQNDTYGSLFSVSSMTGHVGISTGVPTDGLDVSTTSSFRMAVTVAASSLTITNAGSVALDVSGSSALRSAVTIAASTLTVTGVVTSTGIETAGGLWVHGIVNAAYLEGDGSAVTNLNGIYLQNASVQTQKLAADAVVNATLLNGSVQTSKVAADAVTTSAILNTNVTAAKLVNSGVFTTDGTGTFPALTIAASAINTGKINTDAVTTNAILNTNVTAAKLVNSGVFTTDGTGTFPALTISNNAINTNKLAADAVGTTQILNGSVTTAKFANGSITLAAGFGTTSVLTCSAPGITTFVGYGGDVASTTEGSVVRYISPTASSFKTLYVGLGGSVPASETVVVTVMKNAGATTLTCTIAAAASSCNDTNAAHAFTTAAGDFIDVRVNCSGGVTSLTPSVSATLVVQ